MGSDGRTQGRTVMDSQSAGPSLDGRTTLSGKTGKTAPEQPISPTKKEDSDEESDEGIQRDTTKRKADTDHRNPAFLKSLKMRELQGAPDFTKTNK